MASTRQNTLLASIGACLRSPMRPCDSDKPIGEIVLRFHKYTANKTLPKCVDRNSNTRVFAVGDTVEVLFPEGTTPDNDVWIVAHKKGVRKDSNAVKIWKRKLKLVLEYCDPNQLKIFDRTFTVTRKCEMRRDPHKRDADGYVQCYCVPFEDAQQDDNKPTPIWIEQGIFSVTLFDKPSKDQGSSFTPEPQQCTITPPGYESSPAAADQVSPMQNTMCLSANSCAYPAEFVGAPAPAPAPAGFFLAVDGLFYDFAPVYPAVVVAAAPAVPVRVDHLPDEFLRLAGKGFYLPEYVYPSAPAEIFEANQPSCYDYGYGYGYAYGFPYGAQGQQ